METYDSSIETLKHIKLVGNNIDKICDALSSNKTNISLKNITLVTLLKAREFYYGQLDSSVRKILNNTIEINGEDKKILTIDEIINELQKRKEEHDKSKMLEPEKSLFDIWTPKIRTITYGSPEYKKVLKELKPALDHHYSIYRHHPEHFENGINDMHLVDLCELIPDWDASSKRYDNDNIYKNVDLNSKKFEYTRCLSLIFKNTIRSYLR